ncbi:hypothetical protein AUEXF2481DRAFT_701524 [Aureobasidium subglaciale EXF-2481]|uniref:Uncharacterized protein n=1 Tax=Aureobasidium subglaciale (strain EXF-2481) TaxID=1043005 RepID=A0A074Y264_AURSE|nr:uncharacterized protein AUEXF2481DRAFT_701524 [Aureobasidium subglaciale EXF-2481]KEQ91800.1 hypothetical protein AUEXF2481DRAFT_701524 [Aureobasidium subglaciale EXF-2481]
MNSLFSFLIIIISCVLCAVTPTQAQDVHPHFPLNRDVKRRENRALNLSDYPPLGIQIPVDHFNTSDNRTYNNRYWINDVYYKGSGPVFFFDVGEANAHPTAANCLDASSHPSNAVMALAKRFDGIVVIFEHRFYGESFPMPMNTTSGHALDAGAYQYLNIEQALEDVVYFSNVFQHPNPRPFWSSLTPARTPWVWIGGSYPGTRGAIMRIRNPEIIFATWASSAPIETRIVDQVLMNGTKNEVLKLKTQLSNAIDPDMQSQAHESFGPTDPGLLEDVDVARALESPLTGYQYYGLDVFLQPFCDRMETMNSTIDSSDNGIALSHNISMAWSAFLVGIAGIHTDALSPLGIAGIFTNASSPFESIGPAEAIRSWLNQLCSELCAFHCGNPKNPHTIQSRFMSIDTYQEYCNNTFPGILPSKPDVFKLNRYGGWRMNPSNTMWTAGELDPLTALTPASTLEDAPGRRSVQMIPDAGMPPPDDEIFGIVHEGMVHAVDLSAGDGTEKAFNDSVSLFQKALAKWLPAFESH